MEITKSTGEKEEYSREKFCDSLKIAGIPGAIVDKTCAMIDEKMKPGTRTEDIYQEARRVLEKENPIYAGKYSLKRALMDLGPAGFLFEKYFAQILKEYGYKTETNLIMQGKCTDHEVDVLAEKDKKKYVIEMKYHNKTDLKTDIKDTMYAYGRFLDIEEHDQEKGKKEEYLCWAITNTQFTTKAIKFSKCKDFVLIGWGYPRGNGLPEMIRKKNLYPVNLIPAITRGALEKFAQEEIYFAKDLLYFSPKDLEKKFNIKRNKIEQIYQQTQELTKK